VGLTADRTAGQTTAVAAAVLVVSTAEVPGVVALLPVGSAVVVLQAGVHLAAAAVRRTVVPQVGALPVAAAVHLLQNPAAEEIDDMRFYHIKKWVGWSTAHPLFLCRKGGLQVAI